MPLSEREQRMLRELEEQLHSEDPSFASSLQEAPAGKFNVRNLVLGLLVVVVGIGVLILGIYQQWVAVGILGFLVMGAGVYFATSGGSLDPRSNGGGNGNGNGGSGGSGPGSPASSPSGGSFMTSLEEKWEQRRQQP